MSIEAVVVSSLVSFILFLTVIANIQYYKTKKRIKTEEEKNEEWLDDQW